MHTFRGRPGPLLGWSKGDAFGTGSSSCRERLIAGSGIAVSRIVGAFLLRGSGISGGAELLLVVAIVVAAAVAWSLLDSADAQELFWPL